MITTKIHYEIEVEFSDGWHEFLTDDPLDQTTPTFETEQAAQSYMYKVIGTRGCRIVRVVNQRMDPRVVPTVVSGTIATSVEMIWEYFKRNGRWPSVSYAKKLPLATSEINTAVDLGLIEVGFPPAGPSAVLMTPARRDYEAQKAKV